MRIVYMGTPDFAVSCLEKLHSLGHEIAGIFCQPDKPQGRKMILTAPPVKEKALELSLPVFQPATLRNGEALEVLKQLNPDLIVVVAYGKILPREILELPKHGCINIHASLLPQLRGAAPIQWAVINGLKKTGVTSMLMDEGLDTGDMLLKAEVEIGENETSAELWDRLSILAAQVLEETIEKLQKGELVRTKQDDSKSTYAPLLSKSISEVDWNENAQNVHNKIRGLYSWPCAVTTIQDKVIKLMSSRLAEGSGKAGEIVESNGKLVIACGDGRCVEILSLQAQGKKVMNSADYLRGNPIDKGLIII
ncbi:MAG: methionyl-tRNA formyltransferase [Clostridia bacterium]|nr:methionyl-tRNA formyltransferase [Clostridia bacterium]